MQDSIFWSLVLQVLQTQLQKVTEQVKQAESHVAQKESDLEALRVQHVEQVCTSPLPHGFFLASQIRSIC